MRPKLTLYLNVEDARYSGETKWEETISFKRERGLKKYDEKVKDNHTMVEGFGMTLEGRVLAWF